MSIAALKFLTRVHISTMNASNSDTCIGACDAVSKDSCDCEYAPYGRCHTCDQRPVTDATLAIVPFAK